MDFVLSEEGQRIVVEQSSWIKTLATLPNAAFFGYLKQAGEFGYNLWSIGAMEWRGNGLPALQYSIIPFSTSGRFRWPTTRWMR